MIVLCGGCKPAYILLMSAAVVVAVSPPIMVVIALLIAAVFVSARIRRRESGPASTRRCWRGQVQKEEAIVIQSDVKTAGGKSGASQRCSLRAALCALSGVHEHGEYQRTHDPRRQHQRRKRNNRSLS